MSGMSRRSFLQQTGGASAALAFMVANGIKSIPVSAATEDTAGIIALTSSGFTVGTSAGANAAAAPYVYMAFAAGSFNAPWTRPQV